MSAAPLPLTVIGGFLGAGKTSLLNHWLRQARGLRCAVLVNDFGALNIDAALIDHRAGDTIALSNGCVCCQIGDDLSQALVRVLDTVPAFDAVLVEASGVSDPWRIAQMGRADPGLRLDGVVVLVDASTALAQADDPLLADTLARQWRAADLIVLNQCDLATPTERQALRRRIAAVAGAVPQFETTQGEVPLALLSSMTWPAPVAAPAATAHGDPVHGGQFETWSCRPSQVFSQEALRAWLCEPPVGLLRLKGVLRTRDGAGAEGWSEVQFAGRRGSLRSAGAPAGGAAVVAIGLRGELPRNVLAGFF